MNPAQKEDAAALPRQRFDDGMQVPQCVPCDQLRLDTAFGVEQVEIRDRLKADDLVATGVVDHQIAGNGKQVRATGSHILPALRSVGACQHFGDHVVHILRRGHQTAQARAQCRLVGQDSCLEPI